MNSETLKALRASIAHWKRMRKNPGGDEAPGADTCVLCNMFRDCEGCPLGSCSAWNGSPYDAADDAWEGMRSARERLKVEQRESYAAIAEWNDCAKAMIANMERLLPKKTKKTKKKAKKKGK